MKILSRIHLPLLLTILFLELTIFSILIAKSIVKNTNSSNTVAINPLVNLQTQELDKLLAKDSVIINNGNILQMTDSVSAARFAPENFQSVGSIPFWDQTAAFASYKKNAGLFKFISLFWYSLRADGSIRKYIYAAADKSIISYAHSHGTKVLLLVANLPDEDEGGDWDYKRVDKVISSETARQKHIVDLVALAKKLSVDGISIDYEALKAYQKDNFTTFIKELSEALHGKGKILSVALHAKIREGDPAYSNGSQAQDWGELSKYADQLHLMTYEEHWSSSSPGPSASVDWVRSILNYAITLIPKEKLFAGVPLYGYDWPESGKAAGLTYQDVLALIKKHRPTILWDEKSKSHYFIYKTAGATHTVWYEDADSFTAKLALFKELGIYNLEFWRLGHEDPNVWTKLQS